MPRRLDPPGTRSRTMGQENGKKVDKSQESWATPTDGEWLLAGPLPPPSKLGRPRSTDLREVPDAIQYMLATGCRLRAIPRCSAPFATVQNHFHPWRDKGVLERMMDALRGLARERAGRDPEPTAAGTGSQPVRTTETAGPSGYGAGKRTRGRRRHIAVDVEGTPIVVQAHTADARNRDGAPEVILAMPGKAPEVTEPLAGSGCSGGKPRARLAETGVPEVPGTVERPRGTRGSRCRAAAGSWSAPSPGCRAAAVWRRTAGGAWRAPWPGRSWPPAGSCSGGWQGTQVPETG